MEMEVKQDDGVLLIKPLDGVVDAVVSREFRGKITDLINKGNKFLVLDLSKVEFMDSSGLGSLISILKLIALNKGSIVLCAVQEDVLKLFRLTRLNQVFQIFDNEKEGVNIVKESFNRVSSNE